MSEPATKRRRANTDSRSEDGFRGESIRGPLALFVVDGHPERYTYERDWERTLVQQDSHNWRKRMIERARKGWKERMNGVEDIKKGVERQMPNLSFRHKLQYLAV